MQREKHVFPEQANYLVACLDYKDRWLSGFKKEKKKFSVTVFFSAFSSHPSPTFSVSISDEVGFEKSETCPKTS